MTTQKMDFEEALDICLDNMLREGATIEDCLKRHPEYAAELEGLLRVALEVREALDYAPSPDAKVRARLAMQRALAQRRAQERRRAPSRLLQSFSQTLFQRHRWAVGAATAIVLVIVGGTGLLSTSANSLPDQPLYRVKRVVETTQLALTFDQQSKAELHASIAGRRAGELAAMGAKGDNSRIERLTDDIGQNLAQVQKLAAPQVRPQQSKQATPMPSTAAPARQGPPTPTATKPPVIKEKTKQLQHLKEKLQKDSYEHDKALGQAIRNASAPAKAGLEKARQSTQQKYEALIGTIDQYLKEAESGDQDESPEKPNGK